LRLKEITVLIAGSPTQEAMYLIDHYCGPIEELEDEFEKPLPEDEVVSLFFEFLRDWASVQFGVTSLSRGWTLLYKTLPPNADCSLQRVLLKAKQSRFEFGEHITTP
jgi:hypothetical protein